MNNSIYPGNYFNPLEERTTAEEIPLEIKADNNASELVRRIKMNVEKVSFEIHRRKDYYFCYDKFTQAIENEIAEIFEELYKLKGE